MMIYQQIPISHHSVILNRVMTDRHRIKLLITNTDFYFFLRISKAGFFINPTGTKL
jgi:hypothetical protein